MESARSWQSAPIDGMKPLGRTIVLSAFASKLGASVALILNSADCADEVRQCACVIYDRKGGRHRDESEQCSFACEIMRSFVFEVVVTDLAERSRIRVAVCTAAVEFRERCCGVVVVRLE